MEREHSAFQIIQAASDVVRYEQTHRVYDLVERLKTQPDEQREPIWYAKWEDRPLTHPEAWDKAIDEVLLVLDSELGRLSAQ